MESLTTMTKDIQRLVGVSADGIWGPRTAQAVLAALSENRPDKEPGDSYLADFPGITTAQFDRIMGVLSVFETGSAAGDYSNVTVYKDGGGGAYRQITYGRHQTTQDGNLDKLLDLYLTAKATSRPDDPFLDAALKLKSYLPTKNKRDLHADAEFKYILRDLGRDPVMQRVQDSFFADTYFKPAYNWWKVNGFKEALSMLVIYDSWVHSGGIRSDIRNKFAEVPPINGGNERDWIVAYVKARRNWLNNHSNKLLAKTTYRMDTMESAMRDNNWDLSKKVRANGILV